MRGVVVLSRHRGRSGPLPSDIFVSYKLVPEVRMSYKFATSHGARATRDLRRAWVLDPIDDITMTHGGCFVRTECGHLRKAWVFRWLGATAIFDGASRQVIDE